MKTGKFADHDLLHMSVDAAQTKFVPSDTQPVRMHAQMAGDPFVSQAQRRYMYAKHPAIAAEFEAATPKGAKLPQHVKK